MKTSLMRRLLAGATGLVIGAVGAVALASPASAHAVSVTGDAICDDSTGEWVITWTVENDMPFGATLTEVSVAPAPESEFVSIVEGATLPPAGDSLTEEHRLIGDEGVTQVTLEVEADWNNGVIRKDNHTVDLQGDCELFRIDMFDRVAASCELLVFIVRNDEDQEITYELTPDQDTRHGHAPAFIHLIDDPSDFLPPPDDAELLEIADVSAGETVALTLEPGEVHAHGFEGFTGLTVSSLVRMGDRETPLANTLFDIMVAGLDCDDDGGGAGEEPGLPVTGASTALMAAGALALLALGGGMFMLARRRRVTFTA